MVKKTSPFGEVFSAYQPYQPGDIFPPEDAGEEEGTGQDGEIGRDLLGWGRQKGCCEGSKSAAGHSQRRGVKGDPLACDFQEPAKAQQEVDGMGDEETGKVSRHAEPGQQQI